MVKNLPAMQETQVWSLGQEDPLEKGVATNSSILAWRIPWIEKPDGLQPFGSQRVCHNWATTLSLYIYYPHIHKQMKFVFCDSFKYNELFPETNLY